MEYGYNGLLSCKYDGEFKEEGFKWLPWIGKDYDDHRILILGASHHAVWKDDSRSPQEIKEVIDADPNFQRDIIYSHGIMDTEVHKRRMIWDFADTMLGVDKSPLESRKKLWSSMAFMNALQETMVDSTLTDIDNESAEKS